MHVIPDNDKETVKNGENIADDYTDMALDMIFGN